MVASTTAASAALPQYAVVATVNFDTPLGDGLALDPDRRRAYVSHPDTDPDPDVVAGEVSVVDLTTHAVEATISMPGGSGRIAVDPAADRAYVVTSGNQLTVVDTTDNTVDRVIGGFSSPVAVAVDPSTHKVYVTNYDSQTVSIIDTTISDAIINTEIVESRPWAIDVDPTTHKAYASTLFGGAVGVVSGSDIVKRIYGFGDPIQVTVDPTMDRAYVISNNGQHVSMIDTSSDTAIGTFPAGSGPSDIAVDPRTHTAFVTNRNDDTVSVIDQTDNTVVDTVPVGDYPIAVRVDPRTHRVYVTNSDSTVSVLAAPFTSQAITFDSLPPADAVVGDTYTVTATGGGSDEPVTFSTASTGCTVTAGGQVSFTHVGGCVVAADQAGDSDHTDAPTETQTVPVDKAAQGIAFTSVPQAVAVGDTYEVTATGGGSGEPVTFSVDAATSNDACTVTGGSVNLEHVGTCVIEADQAGSADYLAAPTATQSFTVGKGAQSITFTSPPPPDPTIGDTYAVTATGGGSGEPVTFTIDPATTNDACTITGPTVSLDHAGSCVIAADQAGSADHLAAPTATQQLSVSRKATSTTLTLPPGGVVFGEAATATAEVTGTPAGSVQFSVDGDAVGDPVTLQSGTAVSPDLDGLAVGAHVVGAVLTPTDGDVYAGSSATPATLTVAKAATTSTLTIEGDQLTTDVTATAPGAGVPTGTVRFYLAGTEIGSAALDGGTANLAHQLPNGSNHQLSAEYAGDASFTGSSASTQRYDPVIFATVTSAAAPRHDWYAGPVTVSFTCKTTKAPLAEACPVPVTLSSSAAGQSVTRTIVATDGGAATVVVNGINIDRVGPTARVTGVRAGATYLLPGPRAGCRATDSLSGVDTCSVRRTVRGNRVTYVATATDLAGNSRSTRLVARTTSVAIVGASVRDGHYTVHRGRTYTVLVAATSRPRYVYAAPAPRRPHGGLVPFERVGKDRWALGVTFKHAMRRHTMWNIGTRVGDDTTVTTVRVVR